jgi:hypothetical protein
MRVKSEIWVKAYLRYCQAEGVTVVIARRGDEDAGAIFISINRLDGTVRLYGPAPAGIEDSNTDRRWVSCFGMNLVSEGEAESYLAREAGFDSDIWIIEVEDRAGRNFLGDAAVED